MGGLTEALIDSGWLALDDGASELLVALPIGADVLPVLAELARRRTGTLARPRTSKTTVGSHLRPSLAEVLDWAMRRGAKLTVGWSSSDDRPLERWLAPRLMWCPRGVPAGRKVAWVSSRLGRAIDERPDWFAVLRSAVAKLDPERDVLLTASSTTVDRFLERATILFGLRRLRVHVDERRSLVDWLKRLRRQVWRSCLVDSSLPQLTDDSAVFLSPLGGWALLPVTHASDTDGQECPSSDLPLSDRVLIAAADQVLALQVRPKGNLHRLLRARLTDSAWPTASVWLALGETLVPADVAAELQSLGAVGWRLLVEHVSNVLDPPRETSTLGTCSTTSEMPWLDGDYLVHWTRRRNGPWPGQSESQFIDDLVQQESTSHSAFATLSRIVQQRRLIASRVGIRGNSAVVSFSANSLNELTRRRAFRAHRGRWDGEAYGLCIRREWLQARGAKPVIYGDDSRWSSLPNSDRPFFQLTTTRSRGGAKVIDWSQEAEWRVPQDVDLSEASRDDLRLFVPTQSEAQQLAAISPWPVLVAANTATDVDGQ